MTVLHYWKLSSNMNIAVYVYMYVCSVVEVADVNYPNVWICYFPPYTSGAFLYMWDSIKILFFCAVCTVTILPVVFYDSLLCRWSCGLTQGHFSWLWQLLVQLGLLLGTMVSLATHMPNSSCCLIGGMRYYAKAKNYEFEQFH